MSPNNGKVTFKQLQGRVQFLKRNLLRGKLATEDEVNKIAKQYAGSRSKDALWGQWAELKAIAIARARSNDPNSIPVVDEGSLAVAVAALGDHESVVELPSIKREFNICPASYLRIEKLEAHAWWLARLEAARAILLQDATGGKINKHVAAEVCEKCERPLEPGDLDGTLQRIQQEISVQRSWVYAQVTAPSPAPVDEPVDWGDKVTPAEDLLLMQAYHRVNYDVVSRLPEPKSEDGVRMLPRSWAFLFSHQADREHRPSREVMRDRSLASVVAVIVLEAIRGQMMKAEGKVDKDELKQAVGSG